MLYNFGVFNGTCVPRSSNHVKSASRLLPRWRHKLSTIFWAPAAATPVMGYSRQTLKNKFNLEIAAGILSSYVYFFYFFILAQADLFSANCWVRHPQGSMPASGRQPQMTSPTGQTPTIIYNLDKEKKRTKNSRGEERKHNPKIVWLRIRWDDLKCQTVHGKLPV